MKQGMKIIFGALLGVLLLGVPVKSASADAVVSGEDTSYDRYIAFGQDLKASEVVSAAVRLSPPDETVPIADPEELVALLKEVVIYREDDSYTEYSGQAVTFTLTMADGSQEEITAYSPFLIVNGTGYRAKYGPCEQLSRYANQLRNAG